MDVQSPLLRDRYRAAWSDPKAFASTLLVLFVDAYGTEGFSWAPETIKAEIQDDFGVKLPSGNFDRLMAAISIITTDDFFKSAPDFVQLCNVLSGDSYNPEQWDPADAMEVAWGVTEALLIDPPEEDEPFSDEIRAYIGAVLDREGIMTPPDVLRLGVRDKDLSRRVQTEFSDDPTMFNAIYDFEASKTQEINENVRSSLMTLANQLDALPLRDGDAKGVVIKMLQSLQRASASSSVL